LNHETDMEVAHLDQYQHQHQPEWASLCTHRHNVLIEGPVAETHALLLLLQPHIGKPILWKRPHARLELHGRDAGALILEDVSNLTTEDQTRLLAHVDAVPRTQIVSTSEHPLFTLVVRGVFDAALYYRLNVVLLRT
jgi:Sigma-54 interaction domain